MSNQQEIPNVVLMGMRGSGKTSVGRMLSQRLRRRFIDLDRETMIAFADCSTISEAWSRYGEQEFRAVEQVALARVLEVTGRVISLGGGTIASRTGEDAIQRARDDRTAFTILLEAPIHLLRERLGLEFEDRPSLTGGSPLEELEAVWREREPTYRRLSDAVVSAAGPLRTVVDAVVEAERAQRSRGTKPD